MADWFDENAPPPQDDWFAQNAPKSVATQPVAAPQTTPSDSGFTFLPKSGAQVDVGEARQVAEIPAVQNAAQGALETAASFVPKSIPEAARMAESLSPTGASIQSYRAAQSIAEGRPMDALQGIPVAQRIPEIQAAEQTPPFSSERFKAGFGTLADLLMVGGIGSEIAGGARPVPAIEGATTAPSLTETIFGKQEAPLVQPVNDSLSDLEKYGTQPVPEVQPETTAPLSPQTGEPNAVQEPSTGEILQRQPQETGETGSVGGGVEPSVQGNETPEARQGTEAQPPQDVVTLNVKHTTDELGGVNAPYRLPEGQYQFKIGEQKKSGLQLIPIDEQGNPTRLTDVEGQPVDTLNLHKKTAATLPPEFQRQSQPPQEQVARPEPEVSTFSVETPKDAFGTEQTPVANFLMSGDGVMSKSTAKRNGLYQKNPALWENAPKLSHPTHGKLYGSTKVAVLDDAGKPTGKFRSVGEGGETPDNAAQALYEKGLIADPYPDTMWNALDKESKSARSTLKSQQGQIKDIQKQAGQVKDFGQAQHDSWKQGEPVVQVKDLQVGDTVTVKGQELKVTDIDPDNFDVTLEDGKKYGVQTVKDNTVIYGEHEPITPVQKTPKLLAGENQGDLLSSTQSEPLKLVGEKGTDFGAQQAASEKATAERAQSEKGQMQIGETPPTEPPISTKNAYTEQQRALRGMPEAEQAAKRGFGKVWDEAAAESEKDPTIGRRLVAEINSKPRPISDVENAHLLRREIEAQKEHSDAVDAVNNAKTDADLTAAKARLEVARNDLQDVYDATKSAGTKGGQALAARQMLAKEDYSLAKMEARRRAANDGKPLNETQLAETKALHDKIADLQSKLDAHEVATQFNNEFNKLVEQSRKDARASKATGTRFTDFMDRKANEARSRIAERRGRLTAGFDPTAITDEAVIGASHIAKGLTNFADWSVKMAEEFGDQVRPFLKDIWERAKAFHDANAKEYGDKALARYKTYLGKQTEQIKGKLEAGDFTKAQRQKTQLDKEAFTMRADLQKLKNQFERGVAKEVYKNKTPAQKFWDHFVGVERAMKLSGPEVFGKLGVAAAVREVLAPIEAAGGYGVSKVFPKLAKGTRYEADAATVLRSEIKAKASLFTEGMKDAWQNVKGQETGLDALGKTKIRPDFWYNRIGQMHAAIKAPVKRAEFTRSLEKGMAVAIKNGEDINHPEVMTRLANEAVMESNRAIFQNKTVVSSFFSMLDRQIPAAGRAGRFLFPVVKIPVNIFKELVNLHVGAPIGAARVGMAYWKGVETLPALQREAIIRQLTKGSIGGAGLLWGYYNSDKVRNFFDHAPVWFQHTPMAMILNEGSYLKRLNQGGEQAKQSRKELAYMAKTDIPFMYTIKDIGDALDTHNSHALLGWINNMTQSTVVPQILTQTAKQMDKPGTFPSNIGEKPTFRPPSNPIEAVKAGIPGLRQTVPVGGKKAVNVSRRGHQSSAIP